jgi:hypothetical protein
LLPQSTNEENGCQGKLEKEVQNVVVIHLAQSIVPHNCPTEQQ